jgi:hypothetical protein
MLPEPVNNLLLPSTQATLPHVTANAAGKMLMITIVLKVLADSIADSLCASQVTNKAIMSPSMAPVVSAAR